jgi:hypothetical protein
MDDILVKALADSVMTGRMALEQVPEVYRDEVAQIVQEMGR